MANLIKWGTPETITTLHTTTLDSLTTNTLSAAGTAYDNGATKATFAAFEVYLASLLAMDPDTWSALAGVIERLRGGGAPA